MIQRPVGRVGSAALTLAVLTASLLASASAGASVLLSYPGFGSACGSTLTCVGNTTEVGSVLRLTPANGGQSGAAYSTTAITLGANATFSSTFQFQFTGQGGIAPADGITFVLAASPTGLGVSGGGIGYQGVPNSVAIEYDTFNNGGLDLSSNHVAIDTSGFLTNTATANPYGVANCDFGSGYLKPGCMSNGDIWTSTISYDGTVLSVTVRDGAAAVQTIINSYPINIAALLGTNTAYVGFTAGTGSGYENQDILNFRLANDTSLGQPAVVPEPATLSLVGVALFGFVLRGRRRRAGSGAA